MIIERKRYYAPSVTAWQKLEVLRTPTPKNGDGYNGNGLYAFSRIEEKVSSYCEGDVCTTVYETIEQAEEEYLAHLKCFSEQF